MINDYYSEILDKIKTQIKIKNWREAHQLIVKELNLPYVPTSFAAKLQSMLQLVQPHLVTWSQTKILLPNQIFKLLTQDGIDVETGIGLMYQLQRWNVQKLLPLVQKLLMDPDWSPMLKTHLCFLLRQQNISTTVALEKFGHLHEIDPLQMKSFASNGNIDQTMQILKNALTNYDVTIYDFALKILRDYFDFSFPQLDLITQPALAAATIYVLAQKSLGIATNLPKTSTKFVVSYECLLETVDHWYKIMQKWN